MFWIVVIVAVAAFVLYKRAKNDSGSQNSSGEQVSNQPQGNYFEAVDQKKQETARQEAEENQPIPEDADCDACFDKGVAYYEKGNLKQALKYFRFVAEKQNSIAAQNNIGIIYLKGGNGVAKDVKKAVEWFEKAAEQGDADAQYNLGKCYAKGIGVPKDMRKAAAYFTQAAEQGSMDGQNDLAMCCYTGDGIARDEGKAVALWQKLAEQGHDRAQVFLGMAYANKDSELFDMQKAAHWWEKAAQQGQIGAQTKIGNCYLKGIGVSQDIPKAIEWLTKAAENDDVDAMTSLGTYYFKQNTGEGLTESIKWFEKAANKGSFYAIQMVAMEKRIPAHAGMALGAWEHALEDWKEVHLWASKERDCIDAGQPDAKPEERDRAVQLIDESAYKMGLCYWMMDRYTEAIPCVRDLKDTKAQVLYGVCLYHQANQLNEYLAAYERLVRIETDDQYSSMEKTEEEELVYAVAAGYLSTINRLGLENAVRPDMDAAVAVLQKASASIKDAERRQIVEEELMRYKKTMLGRYKYTE